MNHQCQTCDVPADSRVVRSAEDALRWLIVGDDCFFYTPDGTRLKMSEVPEEFDGSKPEKVVLSIVMTNGTPHCLCAECAKRKPKPNVQQTNFFYLLQDVTR